MQAVPGLVVKSGADAVICAADAGSGLGVAVKVADGGERAAPPALLRVLGLVGIVSAGAMRDLDRFARPWVTGGGRRVGELVADVRLTSA
jgi:L-asparaginase II